MLLRRLIKRCLSHPVSQKLLCLMAALYIRLVWLTSRWETIGVGNRPDDATETNPTTALSGQPVIIAFWHGRLLMMPFYRHGTRRIHVLISGHRDGRLIATVMHMLGLNTIEGSSSRGGARAVIDMLQCLRNGDHVAITPDGPRGPRMHAAGGAITVAKKSGAAIIPLGYATSRCRLIHSWDRFMLAYPFGRGIFTVGSPIHVPVDADDSLMELYRKQLEDALIHVTREASERVNAPVVEQAA